MRPGGGFKTGDLVRKKFRKATVGTAHIFFYWMDVCAYLRATFVGVQMPMGYAQEIDVPALTTVGEPWVTRG